jgi:sterol desaturase/sphingolipid hydroxylase (fatty acid hydroxylase superfamily)
MRFDKINNKGQARLFKNQYLEYLTKTNPLVIWSLYLPILFLFPNYAVKHFYWGASKVFFVYSVGFIFWTLIEYSLHRFVFHHHPKTKFGEKINYIIHGNHHEYPRDKERLFMPPLPSIIISSSFFSLFYFVMNKNAFVFFPGFMFGYLIYGSMHYAIHAFNPPFKWMKSLWRNHHLHHYKHAELGFGVSSTLWDHVFGTMFDMKKVKETNSIRVDV